MTYNHFPQQKQPGHFDTGCRPISLLFAEVDVVAVGFEEGMSYHFGNNASQVTAISQVNIMKHNVAMSNMSILIEMISAVYSNY